MESISKLVEPNIDIINRMAMSQSVSPWAIACDEAKSMSSMFNAVGMSSFITLMVNDMGLIPSQKLMAIQFYRKIRLSAGDADL